MLLSHLNSEIRDYLEYVQKSLRRDQVIGGVCSRWFDSRHLSTFTEQIDFELGNVLESNHALKSAFQVGVCANKIELLAFAHEEVLQRRPEQTAATHESIRLVFQLVNGLINLLPEIERQDQLKRESRNPYEDYR